MAPSKAVWAGLIAITVSAVLLVVVPLIWLPTWPARDAFGSTVSAGSTVLNFGALLAIARTLYLQHKDALAVQDQLAITAAQLDILQRQLTDTQAVIQRDALVRLHELYRFELQRQGNNASAELRRDARAVRERLFRLAQQQSAGPPAPNGDT